MTYTFTCVRCDVPVNENDDDVDGTTAYIDATGSYCCDGWHGHDQNGTYAPNHTLDPDEDPTAVRDYADDCRPTENGWVIDMDPFDIGTEWIASDSLALQIEGNDLVHITDIDVDGTATVTVFASTHPDADVLFTAQVNIFAHRTEEN